MLNIRYEMTFSVTGCANLDLETDRLMEALLSIEESDSRVSDSDVACDFDASELSISVCVSGSNLDETFATGNSVIRSAIHEIGGGTPNWPNQAPVEGSSEYEFLKLESLAAN